MVSCSKPNLENISTEVIDISSINMFDYWRDKQLFFMSCLAVIQYGRNNPVPDQIVNTRYLKQSDKPETYSLVSTIAVWESDWYKYEYFHSDYFVAPADDGEIFYNNLGDFTIDKFQIHYIWDETKFKKDSIFIGNIQAPSDIGTIVYTHATNKVVTKSMQDYIFQVDRFIPVQRPIAVFQPPLDDGAEACQDKKSIVREYEFDESTETWVGQDFVFGYIVGKCGYAGYTATGSSTAHGWSLVGNGNIITISNDTMTNDLLADGLIQPSQAGQKIEISIIDSGVFSTSGIFQLGFGYTLVISFERNIIKVETHKENLGLVSMDRNGVLAGETTSHLLYRETINGNLYDIDYLELSALTGRLSLVVKSDGVVESIGDIAITI